MRKPYVSAAERDRARAERRAPPRRGAVWWSTASAITNAVCTAGLLGVAVWGYFYTIRPAYERDMLAREIRENKAEVERTAKQLAQTERQLRASAEVLAKVDAERMRMASELAATNRRYSAAERANAARLQRVLQDAERERRVGGLAERIVKTCVAASGEPARSATPECTFALLRSDADYQALSPTDRRAVSDRLGLRAPPMPPGLLMVGGDPVGSVSVATSSPVPTPAPAAAAPTGARPSPPSGVSATAR